MEGGEQKKKGVFKGRRRKPKFTRTVKIGAQQKKSAVVRAPSIVVDNSAQEQAIDGVDVRGPLCGTSRAALRKTTKSELQKEVRREKMENERVLKESGVIGKALDMLKSKVARQGEKVMLLSDTVREARQRTREAKKKTAVVGQMLEEVKKKHEIDLEEMGEKLRVCMIMFDILFFPFYTYELV